MCIAILELPASCVLPSADPDIPSQTCNEHDQAPVQDCPQVQLGNGPTPDPELLWRPGVSSWENNSTSFLFTAPHHQKGPLGVSQREESLGGEGNLMDSFHLVPHPALSEGQTATLGIPRQEPCMCPSALAGLPGSSLQSQGTEA